MGTTGLQHGKLIERQVALKVLLNNFTSLIGILVLMLAQSKLYVMQLNGQSSEIKSVLFFFSFFFWVTGELSTLRQMMKVPNEPGLSPNNGLENAFLSDQSMASKGQSKYPGAKTTSHDGKADHVMTRVCHRVRQEERQVSPCKCPCRKYAPRQLAQRPGRLNCRAKQCRLSTSS